MLQLMHAACILLCIGLPLQGWVGVKKSRPAAFPRFAGLFFFPAALKRRHGVGHERIVNLPDLCH
jgi:cytochrome b561